MDVKIHPTKFSASSVEPLIKSFVLNVSLLANDDYTIEFSAFKQELDRLKLDINNLTIQSLFTCDVSGRARLNKEFIKNCGIVVKKVKNLDFKSDTYEIHQVMVSYNRVRNIFHFKKNKIPLGLIAPLESSYERMKDADRVIQFLKPLGIDDYYLYFYTLFACTSWGAAWSLRSCHGPKAIDLFASWKDRYSAELMQESLNAANEVEAKSPWVNIFPHIEDKKKRLLEKGYAEVCLSRPEEFFGYHPKSLVCANCPLKGKCASAIYTYFQTTNNTTADILTMRTEGK